jgi:hypothetical protein
MQKEEAAIYFASIPKFLVQVTWIKQTQTDTVELSKLAIDFFIIDQKIVTAKTDGNCIVTFHKDKVATKNIENKVSKTKKLGLKASKIEDGIDNCIFVSIFGLN